MNTDDKKQPPTDAEKLAACSHEIAAILRTHGCRLVAVMMPAEPVGDGSRILLSAECRVILSN